MLCINTRLYRADWSRGYWRHRSHRTYRPRRPHGSRRHRRHGPDWSGRRYGSHRADRTYGTFWLWLHSPGSGGARRHQQH